MNDAVADDDASIAVHALGAAEVEGLTVHVGHLASRLFHNKLTYVWT